MFVEVAVKASNRKSRALKLSLLAAAAIALMKAENSGLLLGAQKLQSAVEQFISGRHPQ